MDKQTTIKSQHTIVTTSHTIVCALSGVTYRVLDNSGLEGYKISQPVHPMMLPHCLDKVIHQEGVAIEFKVGAVLASLHYAGLTKHSKLLTVEQIAKINYLLASSLENEDCVKLHEAITTATSKLAHHSYIHLVPKINIAAILDHNPRILRGLMLSWLKAINKQHTAEINSYIAETSAQRQRSLALLSKEEITKLAYKKAVIRKPMTANKAASILAKAVFEEAKLFPNKDRKSLQKATKQFNHLNEAIQAKLLTCYEEAYEIAKKAEMMNKYSPLKAALIYAIDYLRGEVIPHGAFELDLSDKELELELAIKELN